MVVPDLDARLGQGRIIGGFKGDQVVGGILDGPVSPEQLSPEVQADFMHQIAGGDQQRGDQVVPGIVAQLAQGNLGAGQNDRLVVLPQHEGQG